MLKISSNYRKKNNSMNKMKTFSRSASFSIKSSSTGVKSKIEKVKRLSVENKLRPVHEKIPNRSFDPDRKDLDSSLSDWSFSIESDDNVFCSLPRRVKKSSSPLVNENQKSQPIRSSQKVEKISIFSKLKNLKRRKSKCSIGTSNGEKHPNQILGTNSPILAAKERLIDEIVIWEESFDF